MSHNSKVTPALKAAVIEWYRQKLAIGTVKNAAHRFSLNEQTIRGIIIRWRRA